MGTVTSIDTVLARPRRQVQRVVVRCKRCRVPQAAPGFCGECSRLIDAEGDVLRYAKLREEAARLCCGCLWVIQPRERVAVDIETGDLFHEVCAPCGEQEAAQAGEGA